LIYAHALLNQEYEEVIVPPARSVPPKPTERLIPVAEMNPLAKGCFPVSLVTQDVAAVIGYTETFSIE